MKEVRIAILDTNDHLLAFMDNTIKEALHYFNEKLHTYLEGNCSTFEFTTITHHEDSVYLTAGNKLSFVVDDKPFYFNIVKTNETENYITCTCYALVFELLNEKASAYKSDKALTFVQYFDTYFYENKFIKIGINEIADKTYKGEWTSTEDTLLARLYDLAKDFNAELEFLPVLNRDYSLNRIDLNIYRKYVSSNLNTGVGTYRDDITLKYGENVTGITKSVDVTELYTAIVAKGKNGLNIKSHASYDDGKYKFTSGETAIYATESIQNFPSNLVTGTKSIMYRWQTEYDNVNTLFTQALNKLKELSTPQVSYEISGYFDLHIGDRVKVTDDGFANTLYLMTRVVEQEISFTDETKNTTRFDNTTEMASQISTSLQDIVRDLQAKKTYQSSIIGNPILQEKGTTTILDTSTLIDGDVVGDVDVNWYVDGVLVKSGGTLEIGA